MIETELALENGVFGYQDTPPVFHVVIGSSKIQVLFVLEDLVVVFRSELFLREVGLAKPVRLWLWEDVFLLLNGLMLLRLDVSARPFLGFWIIEFESLFIGLQKWGV